MFMMQGGVAAWGKEKESDQKKKEDPCLKKLASDDG